jgi:hypothetical protein
VVHGHHPRRAERGRGEHGLAAVHAGQQRDGRLAVREADARAVDGQEREVDRALRALGDAPPPAVPQRVAGVHDARAVALDEPVDLRVARPVGRGQRGAAPAVDLDGLPEAHGRSATPASLELAAGLRDAGLLQRLAAVELGAEGPARRAAAPRRARRVGVVAVQVVTSAAAACPAARARRPAG